MAKKESVKKTTKKTSSEKVEKIEEMATNEPIQSDEIVEAVNEIPFTSITLNNKTEFKQEENVITFDKSMEENKKIVDEPKEKITENNNRINQRLNNIFGYIWNGQEMDY